MNIQIRSGKIEDLGEIQKLSHLLFVKEQREYDSLYDTDWPFNETGIDFFKKQLTDKNRKVFIAETGGNIIGYLAASIRSDDEYKNTKNEVLKIAEINNTIVLEEYRSRGIGTQLVDDFKKWAKENNADRIMVLASSPNLKGIDFYKKQDFEVFEIGLKKDL
ncbi:MAG: GCN5-like protein N-acetyltransferase [Berkelbacteria bacterium GW2011_GWE1_39_12]|uniref:GCN5-like protein N-acetyltransferase n=1 Tax=Berkelbacteria bacterium GW2011_GWE1_39_12 TaxID=1618337 RepID=A0A0G4B2Y8_9BACT|nr:MAG: GCN5-like protein N-acetyltransferase [Berkelbacteria bacterium GW2011_GWE1_39_12]HBP51000.1 GNAT family N-acetyltransferase [Candidatus Shapirobacteria bacterium]